MTRWRLRTDRLEGARVGRTFRIPLSAWGLVGAWLTGTALARTQFDTSGVGGLSNQEVFARDVDGDGRIDVITVDSPQIGPSLAVTQGEAMGISKVPPILSPLGASSALAFAVGDLDADGDSDALAAALDPVSAQIRLFRALGDGAGHFVSTVTPIAQPWTIGRLADSDLDGDLDLVAVNPGSVVQLRNDGTGSFSIAHIEYDPGLTSLLDLFPHLVVEDLDQDGDPDAAAMMTHGGVRLYMSPGTGPGAMLTYSASYSVGWTSGLTATDLHGDGDIDLATSDEFSGLGITVFESLGGGNFAPYTLSQAVPSPFIVGADVDLDSRGDLVTRYEVYTSGASGPPLWHSSHTLPRSTHHEVADFNGDLRPDLLLFSAVKSSPPLQVAPIAWNDGTGRFAGGSSSTNPQLRGAFALGHFDGDSLLDALIVEELPSSNTPIARIARGNGDGTFTPNPPFAEIKSSIFAEPPMIAVDVNHDSRPDLLVVDALASSIPRISTILTDGAGGFAPTKKSNLAASAQQFQVGFIDADPHPDVVLQSFSTTTSTIRVAFGNGLGDFVAAPLATTIPSAAFSAYPEPIAVVDVTGDGLDDLIVRQGITTTMQILRGIGDGSFLPHASFFSPLGLFVVARLDGDSQPDLALLTDDGSTMRLEVRPGLSGGTFGSGTASDYGGISTLAGFAALDVDDDGWIDLVGWSQQQGNFFVASNDGGAFAAPAYFHTGLTTPSFPIRQSPLFGDLDLDGRIDALVAAGSSVFPVAMLTLPGTCRGTTVRYGHGCPGAGGFVPKIAIVGAPCPGDLVTFEIRDGLGGSFALVFVGGGEGAVPVTGGCDLLLAPLLPYSFAMPLSGAGPGQGEAAAIAFLPPSIDGATFTLQAFVADPTFAGGVAASTGLAARFLD
jgi:hypothetical protein